ncbi:MAG: protein-glutamate O-methyltransferase CheR [Pseudomonadota bacterium]
MSEESIVAVEMALLVDAIRRVHGYDFSGYAEASLARRLALWLGKSGFDSFGTATSKLLRDPVLCRQLVQDVTVNVTDMFRDPHFFKALREEVVPHLRTWPHAKIWVAGCASGEEVYSLAIILREEGLEQQCRIYATDLNEAVLEKAREGVFALRDMQRHTRQYQQAGGQRAFSDYYVARYERAIFDPTLVKNVVFAAHNLATDADFSEMQLILCRNVMIYFKPVLKERLLGVFDHCLSAGGFLCLGTKEALDQRRIGPRYQELRPGTRIYRKQYAAGTP